MVHNAEEDEDRDAPPPPTAPRPEKTMSIVSLLVDLFDCVFVYADKLVMYLSGFAYWTCVLM